MPDHVPTPAGLRFGAVFPTTEIGNDPVAIRDFAQAAEGLGYDRIVFYDHVLGADHANREPPLGGPYTPDDPFHEPLVLMGYLAAVTERIELATGVLILPQRQTALVAKQVAEIDLLSDGRVVLGVGIGWNHVEYDVLGLDFHDRGRRLTEQIEVLRRLWREDLVDFTGRDHRIDRASINPRPGRDIPIWFGGRSQTSLQRAARLGDGYVFASAGPRMREHAATLQGLLHTEGRDPSRFGMEEFVEFTAGPEAWRAEADAWLEAGGTHLSMRAMTTRTPSADGTRDGFTTPQEHIEALERFVAAVR